MTLRHWVVGAVLVVRIWANQRFPLCAEDAYITFHASKDWAWMHATTSPGYAFLLQLTDPATLARLLAFVADGLLMWFLPLSGVALICFALFWSLPFFIGSAVSGLETHLATVALLLAPRFRQCYAMAAALRPDTAVISLLLSGKHWRWAAYGGAMILVLSLAVGAGTVKSKFLVYGLQWFGGPFWLAPLGFGLLTVGLLGAFWKPKRPAFVAAGVLGVMALLAMPYFWWYAVTPLALLGYEACSKIKGRLVPLAASIAMLAFVPYQWHQLTERTREEGKLWQVGEALAAYHPAGTVALEPAGIIPYLNQQLEVIDDAGLVTPWVAERRVQGDGWMADILTKHRPEWWIMRSREYLEPGTWQAGAGGKWHNAAEAKSFYKRYLFMGAPTALKSEDGRLYVKKLSGDMIIASLKE